MKTTTIITIIIKQTKNHSRKYRLWTLGSIVLVNCVLKFHVIKKSIAVRNIGIRFCTVWSRITKYNIVAVNRIIPYPIIDISNSLTDLGRFNHPSRSVLMMFYSKLHKTIFIF